MNSHGDNADWLRLVRKTRRRPLMLRPGVRVTDTETRLRPRWSDRLVGIAVGLGLGVPVTWMALQPNAEMRWLMFLIGPLCLWMAATQLLFSSELRVSTDHDAVFVRYGFVLLPVRLTLPRNSLIAEYCTGAETGLSNSLRGFKFVVLRHQETDAVAHVVYAMVSDKALLVFDALAAALGGAHNRTQAVIATADGSMVKVDRLATWAAGKWRSYRNELTDIPPRTIEVRRTAFGENRNVVDSAADTYPVRITAEREVVRIQYSNGDDRSVPDYDCVAIQVCREEIPQRRTRHEVNLITDSSMTERLNLLSFDLRPDADAEPVFEAARRIARLLELEVLDHISG